MRSPYGAGGTPTDLGRVPWKNAPRAYGLRSQSSTSGYYPAYGTRPRRKTRKDIVDRQTNLVAPVAQYDDDAPAPRFVREVSAVVDFDRENRPAYN
jgi:hypothetical protein